MSKKSQTPTEAPTNEERAMVPKRPMCSLVPDLGTPIDRCPTNINLQSPWGKAALVNAMSASEIVMEDGAPVDLVITNWLVHRVEQLDEETGEMREYPRTVLFTKDCRTFATTSMVIPHRLHNLVSIYSPEEWAAGIHVQIYSRKKRTGMGSYHELRAFPS